MPSVDPRDGPPGAIVRSARAQAQTTPTVLLGAGKQAEHILRLLQWDGRPTSDIVLFDDAFPEKSLGPLGNPVTGRLVDGLKAVLQSRVTPMVALGAKVAALRFAMFNLLYANGIVPGSAVHRLALISPYASVGPNALIMPGCVVNGSTRIGALAALFGGVTVEHDCVIGDNVTFGAGATLAGNVQVGSHTFIGAGACIGPEISIGERAIIGAGAVVIRDIEAGTVAYGAPARSKRPVGRRGDDAPTAEALREAQSTIHAAYGAC